MMTNQTKSKPHGSIRTTWELRTYDVWGNAKDGYDVNDVYNQGEVEMRIPQTRHNIGTPGEFVSAYPTLRQIKRAVGINPHCRIADTGQGDDLNVYIERKRDGYPLCELRCTSHESLSPVRVKAEVTA